MQRDGASHKALHAAPSSPPPPPPPNPRAPRPSDTSSSAYPSGPSSQKEPPLDTTHASPPAAPPPKALRFVTNYGAPHPKRRRIGAACLTCRKRKTACSGERPACETCKQNRQVCAGYSDPAASTPRRPSPVEGLAAHAPPPPRQFTALKTDGAVPAHPAVPTDKEPKATQRRPKTAHPPPSASQSALQSPNHTSDRKPLASESPKQHESATHSLFSGPRNRMPYFRWLGPTAIMPGFKQMMVKVKRDETDAARSSSGEYGVQSPVMSSALPNEHQVPSIRSSASAQVDSDARTPLELPFYDASLAPPSELITHLTNTFFTHLGCNFPFLQRERFLRDLEEKQVDVILVDAVCALAARFSTHPLLGQHGTDSKSAPCDYGHAFAQRAKVALVDAFHCPTIAATQAALLIAYNEFGEQKDSGLWMYLGIAIRLAEDLGMHKLEGLKFVGFDGPTPRMAKAEAEVHLHAASNPASVHAFTHPNASHTTPARRPDHPEDQSASEEDVADQSAAEQERVDTFWAIFFLDRVVSSGTGRRSTLRDKDIELSFPPLSTPHGDTDWPSPFPSLIRIVHLYGRVADLLNSFKEPSDLTTNTLKRLAAMESQVTNFYQGLSARLHFDAVNFQHYMKAGEGTNFVLLHFWFHTLIVQLHQPTLLKTFGGRMLQLFPNSQQLSMSSAKTIADILSYSHLMDAKASLGNPFTTQPIYIAACAFLKEIAEQTATSHAQTRSGSAEGAASGEPWSDPPASRSASRSNPDASAHHTGRFSTAGPPRTQLTKHSLLATAASQHYQLCYKALRSLNTYWAGTKYILTVLDQKFEGVRDPLLYTAEEGESAMERPKAQPAFTSPGWRRKLSGSPDLGNMPSPFWRSSAFGGVPDSPMGVNSTKGNAIGWTLTGTMNSPSTQVAWHYVHGNESIADASDFAPSHAMGAATPYLSHVQARPLTGLQPSAMVTPEAKTSRPPQSQSQSQSQSRYDVSQADAESLLALSASYVQGSNLHAPVSHLSDGTNVSTSYLSHVLNPIPPPLGPSPTATIHPHPHANAQVLYPPFMFWHQHSAHENPYSIHVPDVQIESQDIDMSVLGSDMPDMPWFEYPVSDMTDLFDEGASTGTATLAGTTPDTAKLGAHLVAGAGLAENTPART